METTITKRIKGRIMEALFENSKVINIKHFRALDLEDETKFDPEHSYKYEILIRHPENTVASKLLTTAIASAEETPAAESKQPLYKVLNEKRTQSKWETSQFKEGDYSLCKEDAGDMIAEGMIKDDAEYTVLAVNNLANIADNLARLIDRIEENNLQANFPSAYERAKAALQGIS